MELSFTRGNAKLKKNTLTFNLPAGHACPFARQCLAKADRETGELTDGPEQVYRCYGAMCEARSPSLRRLSWGNWDILKEARTAKAMAGLIDRALAPWLAKSPDWLVRIHSTGGDFWNREYFRAWCEVARRHPGRERLNGMGAGVHEPEGVIFYSYTKATPFMALPRPGNFRMVASRGGTRDDLIDRHRLREAVVCFSEEEAAEKGLECDPLDDSHAWTGGGNFALIIHGTQKAGSEAGRSISANRRAGRFSGYHKH